MLFESRVHYEISVLRHKDFHPAMPALEIRWHFGTHVGSPHCSHTCTAMQGLCWYRRCALISQGPGFSSSCTPHCSSLSSFPREARYWNCFQYCKKHWKYLGRSVLRFLPSFVQKKAGGGSWHEGRCEVASQSVLLFWNELPKNGLKINSIIIQWIYCRIHARFLRLPFKNMGV